jgi:hypothetical protein
MSADYAITHRLAFEQRVLRRVVSMPIDRLLQLRALYRAYDRLELRARLVRTGHRLIVRRDSHGAYLSHRRAA